MNKKRGLLGLIIFIVILLILGSIYITKNKSKDDIKLINSKESSLFDYNYSVIINSNKESPDYVSINFIIDIIPKVDGKFKDFVAKAYINEDVQEFMAIKSYYDFGNKKEENLCIDRNSDQGKDLSIARGTWIYKDTDLDKLEKALKLGIDVELNWNDGKENVHIDEVNIERYN